MIENFRESEINKERVYRRVKPVQFSTNAILWDAAPNAWVVTNEAYITTRKDEENDEYIPIVIVRLGKNDKIDKAVFSARRINIDGLTGYFVEASELDATFE